MVYLGVDLHRKVSHVVAMDVGGDVVSSRRISTDPLAFLRVSAAFAVRDASRCPDGWPSPPSRVQGRAKKALMADCDRGGSRVACTDDSPWRSDAHHPPTSSRSCCDPGAHHRWSGVGP